jgi:hypothetical protein
MRTTNTNTNANTAPPPPDLEDAIRTARRGPNAPAGERVREANANGVPHPPSLLEKVLETRARESAAREGR